MGRSRGRLAPAVTAIVSMTAIAAAFALDAGDAAGRVCVINGSDRNLLFVAEADNGRRELGMLAPDGFLCVESGADGGTIGVFENEDAVEGCSRLARTGEPERLMSYASFDNCAWKDG